MESTEAGTNGNPRKGLRERLKASEAPTLPAETVQRLSKLPERLIEAARTIERELEETAERAAWRLDQTANQAADTSKRILHEDLARLTDQDRSLTETERNLALTVERLRRQIDRIGKVEMGVILMAILGGILGGVAAALMILSWMQ
jgi:hypothetical protein